MDPAAAHSVGGGNACQPLPAVPPLTCGELPCTLPTFHHDWSYSQVTLEEKEFKKSLFLKKTLPEAQRTQGIASLT